MKKKSASRSVSKKEYMYLLQLERSTEENTLDLMVRNFLKSLSY